MRAKHWTILGLCLLLIAGTIAGWFVFRQKFYVFLMYHGKGNWASTRLANLPNVDVSLLEENLESDKWFVRCSVLRTLRKMDDKEHVLPVLERHAPREKHAYCLLELAVALAKFGEGAQAKSILQTLTDDPQVGPQAKDVLQQMSRTATE
jgi:hypothetical protein